MSEKASARFAKIVSPRKIRLDLRIRKYKGIRK